MSLPVLWWMLVMFTVLIIIWCFDAVGQVTASESDQRKWVLLMSYQITTTTTSVQLLCRSACISRHLQLRTGGFY